MTLTKRLYLFDTLLFQPTNTSYISTPTPYLTSTSTFIHLNTFIIAALCATLVSVWVVLMVGATTASTSPHLLTTSPLQEAENDVGNLYDLQLPAESLTVTFLVTLGLVFALPTVGATFGTVLVFNTLLTGVCLLTPPTVLCVLYGRYALNYIKGAATKNTLVGNLFCDTTALVAFFTRFGLQVLRYVLVLVKLAVLGGFLNTLLGNTAVGPETASEAEMLHETGWSYVITKSAIVLTTALHYVAELLETFLVYYAQTGALVVVVVWLLSALYSYAMPETRVRWYASRRQQ